MPTLNSDAARGPLPRGYKWIYRLLLRDGAHIAALSLLLVVAFATGRAVTARLRFASTGPSSRGHRKGLCRFCFRVARSPSATRQWGNSVKPDNPKISAGVAECLNQCSVSRMPWKTAARFIDTLKISKDWTDAEIIQLQTNVIAALLQERANSP